jgi:membrane-associated protease RseP (regulator of RpoE activity)
VIVLRDGRHDTIYITYRQDALPAEPPVAYDQQRAGSQAYLGVMFDAQVRDAALVLSVVPDSPAAHAGLRAGDMIVALNSEPVSTYHDAIQVISMMRPGDRMAISYSRRVENETQALLAARPGATVHTAARPPDVAIESNTAPVPPAEPQPIEVPPANDNQPQLLDRDRGTDRPIRNRPLLPRLLD